MPTTSVCSSTENSSQVAVVRGMPQRISAYLAKWCVNITYYYAFVLGVLPAPFNRNSNKFEISRAYLVYSAIAQCVFLALSPLGTPLVASLEEKKEIYMFGHVVLQWIYYAGKITRILTIVVLSVVTWLRRHSLMDLYESYRQFEMKYEAFQQLYSLEQQMQSEVHTITRYTIYKFFTTHAHSFIIAALFLLIQHPPGLTYDLMVFINFLQTFHLLVSTISFCVTLSRMHLHFVYINKSLELLMVQKCSLSTVLRRCWTLYCMHFECYHLSRRILSISGPVTLCMMTKIFMTNVVLLYHAVQFMSGSIEVDNKDHSVGSLSIVFFYWDAFLIMIAIDNIQTSCNRTAEILSDLSSLQVEEDDEEDGLSHQVDLTKMLSQFHQYLACHKLTYYIFGLFPLDKATCLQYLISALMHVILLMQYDLKLRS